MKGFFSGDELKGTKPDPMVPLCGKCRLYKGCQTPKMPVSGKGRRGILICGEAPGKTEDERGIQFIGKTGNHLKGMFRRVGIDMRRDCWITNSIICRPKGNQTPTKQQIGYCRANLLNAIHELEPTTIILVGGAAIKSLIEHITQESSGSVSRWVGWTIPDQRYNAWICPVYHPSYLMRQNNKALDKIALDQLRQAVGLKGRPWEKIPDYKSLVEVIYEPSHAARLIRRRIIPKAKYAAFDYETNMLKPDGPDAEIVAASIAWEERKEKYGIRTIAFPIKSESSEALVEFLKSDVRKIGANIKFEERWSARVFGSRVRSWYWDTMQWTHILDNREGITGLKFQAYVLLGFPPYNHSISSYLKSENARSKNKVRDANLGELLLYNGLDSLLAYKVFEEQKRLLKKGLNGEKTGGRGYSKVSA